MFFAVQQDSGITTTITKPQDPPLVPFVPLLFFAFFVFFVFFVVE